MTIQCKNTASYRYTWPARNESFICESCVGKLQAVANALGMYLQIQPIENDTEQCRQQVKEQPQ